jgi:hypothetical protein
MSAKRVSSKKSGKGTNGGVPPKSAAKQTIARSLAETPLSELSITRIGYSFDSLPGFSYVLVSDDGSSMIGPTMLSGLGLLDAMAFGETYVGPHPQLEYQEKVAEGVNRHDEIVTAAEKRVAELQRRTDNAFVLLWHAQGMTKPRLDYSSHYTEHRAGQAVARYIVDEVECGVCDDDDDDGGDEADDDDDGDDEDADDGTKDGGEDDEGDMEDDSEDNAADAEDEEGDDEDDEADEGGEDDEDAVEDDPDDEEEPEEDDEEEDDEDVPDDEDDTEDEDGEPEEEDEEDVNDNDDGDGGDEGDDEDEAVDDESPYHPLGRGWHPRRRGSKT